MPTPLVIVGSGGFSRETVEAVNAINAASTDGPVWDVLGYLDDDPARKGQSFVGVEVLGGTERLAELPDAKVVVGPGYPAARRTIVERLALPPERYATLIHPRAVVPPSCTIGEGTVILAGVVCTVDVTIGAHVGVMPNVVFTHDDQIGDYVFVTASVALAGTVRVGDGAYLGQSATVRERLTIGAGAFVGMGAVVTKDVPAREVWVGSPARFVRAVD